jgi:hypothetical protein
MPRKHIADGPKGEGFLLGEARARQRPSLQQVFDERCRAIALHDACAIYSNIRKNDRMFFDA